MSFIDEKDAPEGYVAAEPIQGCLECAFDEDFSECFLVSKLCVTSRRNDKRNVIFKEESSGDNWQQ